MKLYPQICHGKTKRLAKVVPRQLLHKLNQLHSIIVDFSKIKREYFSFPFFFYVWKRVGIVIPFLFEKTKIILMATMGIGRVCPHITRSRWLFWLKEWAWRIYLNKWPQVEIRRSTPFIPIIIMFFLKKIFMCKFSRVLFLKITLQLSTIVNTFVDIYIYIYKIR